MKKLGLLVLSVLFVVSCGEVTSTSSMGTSSSSIEKVFTHVECNENINNYKVSMNDNMPRLNSIGERKMLVVPLIIEGYEHNATDDNLSKLEKAFFGKSEDVEYESVSSYYEKSSYGNLKLSGKVTPWIDLDIKPQDLTTHASETYNDYGLFHVADKVYEWYTSTYDDVDSFDSDNDGFIDSLYIIYSAPNFLLDKNLSESFWAMTSSRYDQKDLVSDKAKVSYFSWSSYDFMFQNYGQDKIDTHTYIHEVGHLLGLKDYYCYNEANIAPMGKVDMMDYDLGDHSAFSKFSLGWVKPYLIDDGGTINLNSFNETGDCLIFKTNNYNNTPFDEYIMMEYITPTNLNVDYLTGFKKYGMSERMFGFDSAGLRITLINAVGVDVDGNQTDDISKMIDLKFRNTGYVQEGYYNFETSMFNVLATMIPSSPNRGHGLFSNLYQATSRDLFEEGDTFDLKRGSVYRNLIPSQTNKYNKLGAGFFQFEVKVESSSDNGCTLSIISLAN